MHEILAPDGARLTVTSSVFGDLRRLGALGKDRSSGLRTILPIARDLIRFRPLAERLRRQLGEDLSGPCYVQCGCRKCHQVLEDLDTKTHGREFSEAKP